MELEYHTVMIPITENFQSEVDALVKERWEVLPGTKPLAIYHLVRIKAQSQTSVPVAGIGGFGDLKIDETKIHQIRGVAMPDGTIESRVVRPDGTVASGEESKRILSGEAKLG